tara:strand:+ start:54 stop:1346 length:1293 start_codon:yes stop_codon:yes gene_type:complete
MLNNIKKIINKIDLFLYRQFGSEKTLKILQNIKETKVIFSSLNEVEKKNEVRFVGGCIRKSLSGQNVDDIDLATSLEPNEVKKRLNKKKIKVIDTGISHGTLTAILNNKKFEITTLRKDVTTDGRHANVEFTTNWEQDALRRDFTINAIYADIDGRIFDPLNGILDLKRGEVKFIGLPENRIQEDYIRILRYFRFFLEYSKTEHKKDTIQSIKRNINGLNKVSNERIFSELKKIISLKNVNNLFKNNQSKEIILSIFPEIKYHERLNNFNNLNKELKNKYDNDLILGLMVIDQSNNHEYFCHKYKTSNNVKKRFNNISKNYENLKNSKFFSEYNIKRLIYFTSRDEVKDLLLFFSCINKKVQNINIHKLLNFINNYKIPKFPVSGDYLKINGYEPGKEMGKKLKLLEEKWVDNNFTLKDEILKKILKNYK